MSIGKGQVIRVLRWGLVVAGGALAVGSIARALTSGPGTLPRQGDVVKAERVIPPLRPGADPKVEVPEGDLVAGNGLVETLGQEVKVAAQVPGVVASVLVKEGQRIEAGTVLLELASEAEKAALTTAETAIAQAHADLAKTQAGPRPEEIEAADREASAAKARAELSAGVLARLEPLGKSGAATGDEVERARLAAAADLEAAKAAAARAEVVRKGPRAEDIAAARARVASATAQRDEAKLRLERLTVKAPSAGEVLQVKYRVGEYYQPAAVEPLVVLGDTARLRVRMDLDERDVARIAVGASAFVTADGFPGRRFAGKVAELGRRMGRKNVRSDDPIERIDTKILEVVIDLDDAKDLVPGLRVLAYATAQKS
ncbi:MAG: HlyD family efflux transporter periplasmic adaptor subunit [Deltaproteobacteria bacterium]|nr:HlyD family efflux transporter periplasmic adaptor subunit [Deltaproteobacteria bacterium]